MFYTDKVKPKLEKLIGTHPQHETASILAALPTFVEGISASKFYPDLDHTQKRQLEKSLRHFEKRLSAMATRGLTESFGRAGNIPELESLYDLVEAARFRNRSQKPASLLKQIFAAHTAKAIDTSLTELNARAQVLDPLHITNDRHKIHNPQDAHLTLAELVFVIDMFKQSLESNAYQNQCAIGHTNAHKEAYHTLAMELKFLLRDLNQMNDLKGADVEQHHIDDFLANIPFRPEHVASLTYNYALHHLDRKSEGAVYTLERNIARIEYACFIIESIGQDPEQVERAKIERKQRKPSWHNINKPNKQDILELMASKASPSKKDRKHVSIIEQGMSKPPDGMDAVVTLYYPEDQDMKKMRDSEFKRQAKKKFVRHLASSYKNELISHYGASEQDVENMNEKGTIPDHIDLTIEHITDRKFGGTNLYGNLIAMPRWINAEKDKMIFSQLALLAYPEKPTWIITWQPRRNKLGSFPEIYIPRTMFNTSILDLEAGLH